MEVKRFWILMPVIPLVPSLVVLWLLTQTRGAVWNVVLKFVLLAAFYICILARDAKLRCPNCGQHIEIVK